MGYVIVNRNGELKSRHIYKSVKSVLKAIGYQQLFYKRLA